MEDAEAEEEEDLQEDLEKSERSSFSTRPSPNIARRRGGGGGGGGGGRRRSGSLEPPASHAVKNHLDRIFNCSGVFFGIQLKRRKPAKKPKAAIDQYYYQAEMKVKQVGGGGGGGGGLEEGPSTTAAAMPRNVSFGCYNRSVRMAMRAYNFGARIIDGSSCAKLHIFPGGDNRDPLIAFLLSSSSSSSSKHHHHHLAASSPSSSAAPAQMAAAARDYEITVREAVLSGDTNACDRLKSHCKAYAQWMQEPDDSDDHVERVLSYWERYSKENIIHRSITTTPAAANVMPPSPPPVRRRRRASVNSALLHPKKTATVSSTVPIVSYHNDHHVDVGQNRIEQNTVGSISFMNNDAMGRVANANLPPPLPLPFPPPPPNASRVNSSHEVGGVVEDQGFAAAQQYNQNIIMSGNRTDQQQRPLGGRRPTSHLVPINDSNSTRTTSDVTTQVGRSFNTTINDNRPAGLITPEFSPTNNENTAHQTLPSGSAGIAAPNNTSTYNKTPYDRLNVNAHEPLMFSISDVDDAEIITGYDHGSINHHMHDPRKVELGRISSGMVNHPNPSNSYTVVNEAALETRRRTSSRRASSSSSSGHLLLQRNNQLLPPYTYNVLGDGRLVTHGSNATNTSSNYGAVVHGMTRNNNNSTTTVTTGYGLPASPNTFDLVNITDYHPPALLNTVADVSNIHPVLQVDPSQYIGDSIVHYGPYNDFPPTNLHTYPSAPILFNPRPASVVNLAASSSNYGHISNDQNIVSDPAHHYIYSSSSSRSDIPNRLYKVHAVELQGGMNALPTSDIINGRISSNCVSTRTRCPDPQTPPDHVHHVTADSNMNKPSLIRSRAEGNNTTTSHLLYNNNIINSSESNNTTVCSPSFFNNNIGSGSSCSWHGASTSVVAGDIMQQPYPINSGPTQFHSCSDVTHNLYPNHARHRTSSVQFTPNYFLSPSHHLPMIPADRNNVGSGSATTLPQSEPDAHAMPTYSVGTCTDPYMPDDFELDMAAVDFDEGISTSQSINRIDHNGHHHLMASHLQLMDPTNNNVLLSEQHHHVTIPLHDGDDIFDMFDILGDPSPEQRRHQSAMKL